MRMSKIAACFGGLLLCVGAIAPTSAAASAEEQWDEMRAGYASLGTPEGTVDALVEKLNSGQPVDAFLGGAPVSTYTFTQIGDGPLASDGEEVTVSTFPDGSANTVAVDAATVLDLPAGEITPMAESGGCRVQTGSGYSNFNSCSITASWSGGVVQLGFVASYSLIQGGYDQIIGTGMTWQRCGGVQCTSPTFTVKKLSEGTSGPAVLRGQSDVSAPWGSWNAWVALNVGRDHGYATSS